MDHLCDYFPSVNLAASSCSVWTIFMRYLGAPTHNEAPYRSLDINNSLIIVVVSSLVCRFLSFLMAFNLVLRPFSSDSLLSWIT